MEITFSNIDNLKQIQRKKKNFINIMPNYLLPHTQIVKRNMFIKKKKTKKLLFQLFNPHPHLEGTLINLFMNEKKNSLAQERGGPLKDRRNQQNKSVGI